MKKLICLMVAAVMICTLLGCSNKAPDHTHTHTHSTAHTQSTDAAQTENNNVSSYTSESSVTKETYDFKSEPIEEETSSTGEILKTEGYPFTKEAAGTLCKKHSDKIDIPFEQAYLAAKSNKEIASLCEEYSEKWNVIAQRYYKEILYYNGSVPEDPNFSTDRQMHEYIEQRKTSWESEFEENLENYLLQLENQYSDADKVSALSGAYKFDMQREFALEMIGIYEMLGEFNNQEF